MYSPKNRRYCYFPKADAAVLHSKYKPPSPASRPTQIGPVLDAANAGKAIEPWSYDLTTSVYPDNPSPWAPVLIPERPSCISDRYLFPVLTRNERLRLTMLFYYTRGALEDIELVSRLQEKVHLAADTVGWEFAIAGLLDHNSYTRMVTVGLPLAVLPRRESTCAHTVNQPPGKAFHSSNMIKDWRFRESPHVEQGGLRAYAGVPLRFDTEFGEHVAFGSLCVASNTEQESLSKSQQMSLARLADWIVSDIIHSARNRRQRERKRMQELLTSAQKRCELGSNFEQTVVEILRTVYPDAVINVQTSKNCQLDFEGRPSIPASALEHGLWEDSDELDYLIEKLNHQDPVSDHVVRLIAVQCDNVDIPTYIVVGSKDFRLVFDDIDVWFVDRCAALLSRGWQGRALKEAQAAKESFLRGITHQLRTPIHGILGSVELLAEELKSRDTNESLTRTLPPPDTPEDEKLDPFVYISNIRNSAKELITTVNSMIKINRWAEIAQAERVFALYNIVEVEAALLQGIIPLMPDDASARPSLIFSSRMLLKYDSFLMDIDLLIDCVLPLVTNAVQNTSSGVVAVKISVTDDCQSLVIDIEDNGCGIRLDDQQRIFHAYEKVNPHTTGAGLGLTLASRVASLMHGTVSLVSSEIGKGSHFRATFNDCISTSSVSLSKSKTAERLHVALAFHRLSFNSPTTLGNYFVDFLTNTGCVESGNPDDTLLVLDYYSDPVKLRHLTSQIVSNQIAICLVPEWASFMSSVSEQIQREGNVLFVKGPFWSGLLERALHEALETLKSDRPDPESPHSVCTVIDESSSSTTAEQPIEPSKNTCSGHFMPAKSDSLTRAIKNLRLSASPPGPHVGKQAKPMTLLVDDNAINLRLLEMYCNRREIRHQTSIDGQKAVYKFSQQQSQHYSSSSPSPDALPFELILMDLQMPICDGIAATRQIRILEKEHGWKKSVILIVTGQDSPSDRAKADNAGADGFLVKPVGPKMLDAKIRHWFPEQDGG